MQKDQDLDRDFFWMLLTYADLDSRLISEHISNYKSLHGVPTADLIELTIRHGLVERHDKDLLLTSEGGQFIDSYRRWVKI